MAGCGFNNTAEFGTDGPVDHFKSLAPDHLYLLEKDGTHKNYSGFGNTLKCINPTSRRIICECLIYWAHEMGNDGFRFDLPQSLIVTLLEILWIFYSYFGNLGMIHH